MVLKNKLPICYLLFSTRNRIDRLTYWTALLFIWSTFYILFNGLEFLISYSATLVLYPFLFWTLFCTATKRLHDSNKRGTWLLLAIIPVFGFMVLFYLLILKKGTSIQNRFGFVQGSAPDYYKNNEGELIPHLSTSERIINDVTQLNPIIVMRVETPQSLEELQNIIKNSKKPISIGGGRFSMGGQTASSHSLHIDMRKLNQILDFSTTTKTIKVQAGIRWCDIQKQIDPHNLSIKIMQSYANFTVGGSLSVNCHGRYIGLGPLILSVKSLEVIFANGDLVFTSPSERPEIFFACIGCYNAIAVIANVTLELEENVALLRTNKKMNSFEYKEFFFINIRDNKDVIFHNADIYPPLYKNVRAVSWSKTNDAVTIKARLMPLASSYPLERYFLGAFSKNNFGKWRREYIMDPILFFSKKVHWRNYEAGYDVLELEPFTRKTSTYVLQEYFVPVQRFDEFNSLMAEIFIRYSVNVLNVSIRHAKADSGSLLAWAREEVFAFVIYYKQYTNEVEKNKVAVWTRELISAAISLQGTYYLPYQPHGTIEQFNKAFPNAKKLMDLKMKLDPEYKFRNVIWETYYSPKGEI